MEATTQTPAAAGAAMQEFRLPGLPAKLAQVDLLKGLAILSVIALHSLTVEQLADSAAALSIRQAVPVFVVMMGLNGAGSMWRNGLMPLGRLYSARYLLSRIDRLYVPFLALLVVSAGIAAARGELTPGGLLSGLVTGTLPFGGPGNYFITFAFQFAVVLPFFYFVYRRAPVLVIAGSFAIAGCLELAAPHIHALGSQSYLYEAAIFRFLPVVALGFYLADRMHAGRGLPRWWWAAAAVSAGYIVTEIAGASLVQLSLFGLSDAGQTFLAAFYPATLVALGLHWLPSQTTNPFSRLLAALGTASYEIFLVQILWFGLLSAQSVPMIVPSMIGCCALGYVLSRAVATLPKLAAPRSQSESVAAGRA